MNENTEKKKPKLILKRYATVGDSLESIDTLVITENIRKQKIFVGDYIEKYFEEEKGWYKVYMILENRYKGK